ncbi:hypothetical protein ACHQM5_005248 [Ranunculus cassubicifolius]
MAESSECSVANSSSTTNLWELNGNSLPSWWNHPTTNPNSNSSCDEDISLSNSFTNTSNHSGLSTDDSPSQLMEAHGSRHQPDRHLWSKVLLNIGSGGGLHNNQDVGENFLEALLSKNLTTDMFQPVCAYLKKMDTSNNSWEYANLTPYYNIETQLNSFSTTESILENDRVNNLSNLVTDWSLAPPCLVADHQMDQYSESNLWSFLPGYANHEMKVENLQQQIEASDSLLHKSFKGNTSIRYQMGQNGGGSVIADNDKYYYGMSTEAPWFNTISFNGSLNKPIIDYPSLKPTCLKASYQIDKKKINEISSAPARRSTTESKKKKRSEDSSDTQLKKPKHENSTVQPPKVQAPKVKLTERITPLQQIVSPFGKTDTASVLQEAIGYIKFLHEQVQLLSNPYMKPNTNKDPWGMLERKDKAEAKFDLRSRGLCLVPISCTPQVYRENTGSDYWTPTYRGCLYR